MKDTSAPTADIPISFSPSPPPFPLPPQPQHQGYQFADCRPHYWLRRSPLRGPQRTAQEAALQLLSAVHWARVHGAMYPC